MRRAVFVTLGPYFWKMKTIKKNAIIKDFFLVYMEANCEIVCKLFREAQPKQILD